MAEINIERKKSIWPWIIAALVAALLIWALLEMLDRDDPVDPAAGAVTADQTATAPAAVAPVATTPDAATGTAGMDGYVGTYVSDSMQLALTGDGAYVMQESPAGEGRGTWTFDASANALHLKPTDGTPDRYFRVEGTDTLVPLDPNGQPAPQMAPLTRSAAQ